MKEKQTLSEELITFFSGGINHDSIEEWVEKTDFELNSYKHELFKFEQTYLKTLRVILDESKTKKVERWISNTHEMGKLFTSNSNSNPNRKALEFLKNNYEDKVEYKYMSISRFLIEEDKKNEILGRKFIKLRAAILWHNERNPQIKYIGDFQSFLDTVEDLENEAKIISEKPTWYHFVNYFFSCIENLYEDLKKLVNTYNINIDRNKIFTTNRPFLDELNTVHLTEFAIKDFREYEKLVKNKKRRVISKFLNFNPIERKLFPDSEVIMHSNIVSGLASPYEVMKKLIVDFILVLDIVLVRESFTESTIQNLVEKLSFSDWTANLLGIYIRIGYPLPVNLQKHEKGWKEKYGSLTALKSVGAIVKQTAPFIIGKQYESPDVKEGLKHPFHTEHKFDSNNHYFTMI